MIKISYTLTRKDYYKTCLIKLLMRREIKLFIAMGIIFILASLVSEKVGIYALVLGVFALLTPLSHLYWTKRLLNTNSELLEPIELSFEDTIIKVKAKSSSSELTWESIHSYKVHKDYIFIFISELLSYAIPKKKLEEDQLKKLTELIDYKKGITSG